MHKSTFLFLAVGAFTFSAFAENGNVLTNPGFELETEGWSLGMENGGDIEVKKDIFHGGAASGYIKNDDAGEPKIVHLTQALRDLPVAGSKISGSVWVKTDSASTKFQVYCDIVASKNGDPEAWFDSKGTGILKCQKDEWQKIEFHFIFPADQIDKDGKQCVIKGCYFRLALSGAGEVWFDDAFLAIEPPLK